MIFFNFLYQKIKFFILLLCILITGSINAQVKDRISPIVTLQIIDENGKQIPDVQVVIGEGIIYTSTDVKGTALFEAFPEDVVTITFPQYETKVMRVNEILQNNIITLVKSRIYMSPDDDIPLPFKTLKKRLVTGSEVVLTADQLEKYPSVDLRNAFTGLVPGLEVRERNGMTGLSAEEKNETYGITSKINVSARGSNLIYIIDDMPSDITEIPLDPQEIESATIIKDIVGKAMYGALGSEGIILIKTRHGKPNNRFLNINLENGVSIIDRMPDIVSGSSYAELNNLARINDNETPLYSPADIAAYSENAPYDMYHPNTNYREMMIKNTKSFKRANVSSSGGNDNVQYSVYLGYNGEGDIYKIGENSDYNRINTRSLVDIKINDLITTRVDIYAGLTFRRSPNYGYATSESSDEMDLVEFNSVINDIIHTPPIAFPIYASSDPKEDVLWYGVSPEYQTNPIGNITDNGYYNEKGRTGAAKLTLEYDMGLILKGLKSKTFFGFNMLDLVRIGKANDYIAYIATPSLGTTGNDTILLSKVHDGTDVSDMSRLHDYYYQRIMAYENLSFDRSFGDHNIQSSLTYFLYKSTQNGIEIPQRMQNGILSASYSYKDKYILQGVLNYSGTYSFIKEERSKVFPSLGAAWVITNENSLQAPKFLDYLKIHAEAGILGSNGLLERTYFNSDWETNSSGAAFGPHSNGQWFGSTSDNSVYRTYTNRIASPALTFEKRKEISFGFDALLFNQRLSLDVNFYNTVRDGIMTQLTNSTPFVIGISSSLPYFNNNKARYTGLETGLNYSDKIGAFTFSIGGNATVQDSKWLKYDEPSYRYDYQSMVGKPVDAYWGQQYIGKFQSDDEATVIPQLYDAVLYKDDLKYRDLNGDLAIDDNDRSVIGHTSPRIFYSAFFKFGYRNFDLTLIGTGRAFYDIAQTNSYFWNGWGNNNYSKFVSDNIGGAYPRLTYYKVNNNFVPSDFWLTKGGFFKIQNVELAYNLPKTLLNKFSSKKARIFVRGSNLLTISEIKDVDPESINSGIDGYPLYKTFTGGLKLTF